VRVGQVGRASVIAIAMTLARPAIAQVPTGPVPIVPDADFPTNMAFAPDGRLLYTELETGDVRVVAADGRLLPTPFASFDVHIGASETGLLGIAIPPDFDADPWVYVYLSEAGTVRNVLVAVRAAGDVGVERRRVLELLTAAHGYHNGGDLLFDPDGNLYVAVGEAHEPHRSQDPDDVGGKVLRIDPEAPPPPDALPGDAVFTLGHRNSFGLCRDPRSGEIWQTENGPSVDDEVNLLREGGNYGWPDVTGRADDPRYVDPVAVFGDTVALTGCAVWKGELYVGAYLTGGIYHVEPGGTVELVTTMPTGVTDLLVGPDDRLHVATEEGIYALGEPVTGSPIADVSERPGTLGPWLVVAVAIVLAVALALRVRITRRRYN
jgi:quinoprotein glucose dehydrogenase